MSARASKPSAGGKPKRPRGRPPKRNPEVVAVILRYLKRGMTKGDSAYAAGIDPDTLLNWQKRDPKFAIEVNQAIALGEAYVAGKGMALIRSGDGQQIRFWLSRRSKAFKKDAGSESGEDKPEVWRFDFEELE